MFIQTFFLEVASTPRELQSNLTFQGQCQDEHKRFRLHVAEIPVCEVLRKIMFKNKNFWVKRVLRSHQFTRKAFAIKTRKHERIVVKRERSAGKVPSIIIDEENYFVLIAFFYIENFFTH